MNEAAKVKLTKKQNQALHYLRDYQTNELLFGGGAGGAKSRLGAYWLMSVCLRYKGTRWLMGRAVKKTLKETTLNTFREVISDYNVRGLFKERENSDRIVCRNGSEILLKDLEFYPSDPNFDELGSLEITGAFIDEVNQLVQKAKNIVRSRIRYKLDENGMIPKMCMACNPAKNWVYGEFYKPWREKTLPQNKNFVQALVTDNPFISDHYIENLRGLDKSSRERLLYGNWEYDDDPATMLSLDQINDLWTNIHVKGPAKKYITADIALEGSDRLVILVWEGWKVIDSIIVPKSTGADVLKHILEMKNKHRVPNSNIIYDADGAGGFLGGETGFLPGAKAFHNGGRAFPEKNNPRGYENLKTQCAYHFAKKAAAGDVCIGAITDITEKELAIQELGELKRKDMDKDGPLRIKSKAEIKLDIGRSPDILDALIMRSWFDLEKPAGLVVIS
jgi:phage terminase large subunit